MNLLPLSREITKLHKNPRTGVGQPCFNFFFIISLQADGHVLPLRLWGMPMKISCPLAPYALPTVSCLASGMVTKISCKSADVLKLKGELSFLSSVTRLFNLVLDGHNSMGFSCSKM